jgi:hypothetical protein
MAKAPSSVNGWDGSGQVWFKIAEIGANISGGQITWPAQGEYTSFNPSYRNVSDFSEIDTETRLGSASVSVKIPKSLPSGEYLLRVESIALHVSHIFRSIHSFY